MSEKEFRHYNDLSDKEVRLGFVRKVYGILSIQILFTALFTLIPFLSPSFRLFMTKNVGLLYTLLVVGLVIECALVCCISVARKVPLNYILLFTFTATEAYIVSFIASQYNPKIVLIAAFMTAGITVGLTAYAYYAKTDFTVLGGIMVCIGVALCIFGLFALIFRSELLNTVYCALGVIAFSIWLVIDS